MKKLASVFLILSLLVIILSGCGSKTSNGEVNVYNWGEYIDESIFSAFEKETGIKVNYKTFSSNETMYSVLKTGGSSYDVIIPSDYMISRLIEEDMLEKIDFSNIPNYSLIGNDFKALDYDPTGEYSVAYMWGTVGIIYNTDLISEKIDSWGALFNPDYEGQILMFDNPRDAIGIALLYNGCSLNTTNESEIRNAIDLLKMQKPYLQAYVMDQIFNKLESGEAAIGPYYAGDYLTMKENNESLSFVVPKEGSNKFHDAMCIPKGAPNKKNAELFINYMCSTDVCCANMDVTGYTSANVEAWKIYAEELTDEEYAIMYPDSDTLSRCEVYINLPADTLALYDALWVELKS